MLPQLERQFLQANLAQVTALLGQCEPDEDVIEHFQYSQLVSELEGKLAAMPKLIEQAPAGVALFFGGRPVVGSQGIQADFGSKAIEHFQKIVSQRFAAVEFGPLASKGRVPLKENSHLLVTDIVRGSFGFVLQAEQGGSDQPTDTTIKAVVDQVAQTLSRVAAQDESLFESAVAEIDDRQKNTLSEFFKLLDTEGATLRLVEGERDFELDRASIQRARQRVEHLQISDRTVELKGRIVGWSDFSAKFDLELHESHEVVQGSVSRAEFERIANEGIEPYHKHVQANVKVREVVARNRTPKLAYTLLSLEPMAAPPDWQPRATQSSVI